MIGGLADDRPQGRARAAPVASTRRLFLALLRPYQVDLVCDIGSMDGSDALRFRQRVPEAQVVAFEANPDNFTRMRANALLAGNRVQVEPLAVCEQDGSADFFVVRVDDPAAHARRGMSSLYRRAEDDQLDRVLRVATTRLDSYIARQAPRARRLALWIDVEGKAFEVIDGARGILEHVAIIHVEVETRPLIGASQKTWAEVGARLRQAGFVELATDHAATGLQFNVLYVRMPEAGPARNALRLRLHLEKWRRRGTNLVYNLLPGRVRGALMARYRIRGSIG